VSAVVPVEGYRLLLTFTNGERRIFDAGPLLSKNVFAPLKNKRFFELAKVGFGAVTWPGDIDYCPDAMYAESVPAE
jgi:hypothetical protein